MFQVQWTMLIPASKSHGAAGHGIFTCNLQFFNLELPNDDTIAPSLVHSKKCVQMVTSTKKQSAAENLNPFEITAQQFDRAAAHMPDLKRGLIEYLKRPQRSVILEFPIEMDDGSVRTFVGYRVLHNQVGGPGKGGIRYHPNVNLDEVRALASWMT